MGKDLLLGMSATFLLWAAAMVWASSRLVILNGQLYKKLLEQDRDTRVKMALWLAIPMLMSGIFYQRALAFYAMVLGFWVSNFGLWSTIAYLADALIAFALALWWAFDRTYGPIKGDKLWCRIMWSGLAAGAVISLLSWWY